MDQKRVVSEEFQDPFLEKVNRVLAYAREQSIPLILAVVVFAAVVVGGVWWMTQRRARTIADYIEIYNAMEGFQKALQATGDARQTDLGNVVTHLSKIADKKSLPRARFFQARAAYEKGDLDEALRLFQETAKPENHLFGLYAQIFVGITYEAQKKYAEAAQAYAESALASFRDVSGCEDALTEAAFGRARVARQLGRPDDARAAYESIIRRYLEARDKALDLRKEELVADVRSFLQQVDAPSTETDLTALHGNLDAWIQATLQKPEAERRRLDDAVRLQREVEDYLRSLAEARKSEAQGQMDTALYSYDSAIGDRSFSPTREQYQRALLELERLALMKAK